MKSSIKSVLFLAVVAVCLGSCNKEEVDIRDAAVGTYNGKMTMYALVDGKLESCEDLGITEESINNVTVSKDATNANAIQINFDGDIMYGSKIAAASNGFSFDMEEQTWDGMKISGYNAVEMGTSKYHGAFFSDTKKISVALKVSISDAFPDPEQEEFKDLLHLAGVTDLVMSFDLNKR